MILAVILFNFLTILPVAMLLEVSEVNYYYAFSDLYHSNWVLDTSENDYLLKCIKGCQKTSDCIGMAVQKLLTEDLPEASENLTRTCHMLSKIDMGDCSEGKCENTGYEVFTVR